jgi:large subunit ribosomal protein L22
VVDLVRGQDAQQALAILRFAPQAASEPVYKVVSSAIHNAEENEGLDADELYISTAFVDEGVTLRRIKPRAKGRADRIMKRGAHITIVVEPREEAPAPAPKPKAAKKAEPKAAEPKAEEPKAKAEPKKKTKKPEPAPEPEPKEEPVEDAAEAEVAEEPGKADEKTEEEA